VVSVPEALVKLIRRVFPALLVVLASASPVWASTIPMFNSGLAANGTALAAPNGGASFFWTLASAPAGATEAIGSGTFRFNCCYFPDVADAAWVSPGATGNAGVTGVYVYQMLLDLTGFDPNTVSITGYFGTDNDGFIRVNGGPNAAVTGFGGFGSHTPFSLTSGFVAGQNFIQVGVNNGGDPTAFFVHFDTQAGNPLGPGVVPEPTTLVLMGLGLAVLSRRLRRA
jgi:hypothetical protein